MSGHVAETLLTSSQHLFLLFCFGEERQRPAAEPVVLRINQKSLRLTVTSVCSRQQRHSKKSQRSKESKTQRVKEAKSQRSSESEKQRLKETESKKQRVREAERQRSRESKKQRVREAKSQRNREAEKQRVRESKKQRVRKAAPLCFCGASAVKCLEDSPAVELLLNHPRTLSKLGSRFTFA
ncbi:uncharacterized protein V6R79_015458 [Siganus canaliculatus]